MNKCFGFVSFYKEENIKEGDIVNKDVTMYPTVVDSLRFFTIEDDIVVTQVSTNKYEELLDSEYYGYFNMKRTTEFKVEKVYSYDEIIEIMTTQGNKEENLERFIQSFKIEEEDKQKFIEFGPIVKNYIEIFQGSKTKTMVKKYGQNNNKRC